MEPDRIFFLDPYTDPTFKSISSPEIGYGISCAHAIKYGMKAANLSVIECSPAVNGEQSKLGWIYDCYKSLNRLSPKKTDIVFLFHSLIHFPGEIRRLINHHTRVGCPIIGYTHGSHWDLTDTIRSTSNPGLLFQDLANLLSFDRLLIVSEYYRELIRNELKVLGPLVIDRFDKISKVVGLPIDTVSIDNLKRESQNKASNNNVRIVFNHALRPPKRPDLALSVITKILNRLDKCTVEITRTFEPGTPLEAEFNKLSKQFNNRIICHGTLTLPDYYKLLWDCDIQFSTASHESFGVATVEAMYTENACFTPKTLSYPEITDGIGNYNNLDELFDLIKKAAIDMQYRKTIAKSQKAKAMNFCPDKIVNKIQMVIDNI